ncbi:hypothetical protein, partial [Streptomyces sp. CHA16]|uniref:hypothetical protein n=1 Tax=Streptomyces sp. CHA16 TaxID=2841667 RepID=UPI00209485B4
LAQLRFKRQRLDGTIEWWTGSAWQTTETAFAATSLPYTFPAGAFTEPSYRWAMAAADADSGAFSAYTDWQAVHNTNLFVRRGG